MKKILEAWIEQKIQFDSKTEWLTFYHDLKNGKKAYEVVSEEKRSDGSVVVRTVLKQDNEDKQWDLYCAITANPLADDVGNFEEFKQRFMSTAPKGNNTEQTEPTMNNAQIKLQVEKANKILNGFVPPLKGGG